MCSEFVWSNNLVGIYLVRNVGKMLDTNNGETSLLVTCQPESDGKLPGERMLSERELTLVPISVNRWGRYERLDLRNVLGGEAVLHEERVL